MKCGTHLKCWDQFRERHFSKLSLLFSIVFYFQSSSGEFQVTWKTCTHHTIQWSCAPWDSRTISIIKASRDGKMVERFLSTKNGPSLQYELICYAWKCQRKTFWDDIMEIICRNLRFPVLKQKYAYMAHISFCFFWWCRRNDW